MIDDISIFGEIDGQIVCLTYQDGIYTLIIEHPEFNISKTYIDKSIIAISACLASIGLSNAIELLESNNIPRTHRIWSLNHYNAGRD